MNRIFQISSYLRSIKEIFNFQNKQYNINNTIINDNTTLEEYKEEKRIQESLPFENKNNLSLKKFVIPELKLLKSPSKNEKVAKVNESINEEFANSVKNLSDHLNDQKIDASLFNKLSKNMNTLNSKFENMNEKFESLTYSYASALEQMNNNT